MGSAVYGGAFKISLCFDVCYVQVEGPHNLTLPTFSLNEGSLFFAALCSAAGSHSRMGWTRTETVLVSKKGWVEFWFEKFGLEMLV